MILYALQPQSIKVPLSAHVGTEDKFFPHKVIATQSPLLPQGLCRSLAPSMGIMLMERPCHGMCEFLNCFALPLARQFSRQSGSTQPDKVSLSRRLQGFLEHVGNSIAGVAHPAMYAHALWGTPSQARFLRSHTIGLWRMQEVEEYVEKIKAGGGQAMIYVYPGEGHAFMNSDPDSFKRMESEALYNLHYIVLHLSPYLEG